MQGLEFAPGNIVDVLQAINDKLHGIHDMLQDHRADMQALRHEHEVQLGRAETCRTLTQIQNMYVNREANREALDLGSN